jgi:phosphoserine phosphatase RsbU/P
MTKIPGHSPDTLQQQAELAAAEGNWKDASELYARCAKERASMLSLINSVQEGLSTRRDLQEIYDLVGDSLRNTFNAQVVMISQYDPAKQQVFHHYAIENGQHLHLPEWLPVDSSRAKIIRTRKPFMINLSDIQRAVEDKRMKVIPGTQLPKTWLGVPMLVGDTVRGVVSLQNLDMENAFSQSDIDLLMTLTGSMTLSLENARLFARTEHLLDRLEKEMLIARKTQRSILPQRIPFHPGYQFGTFIMPARAVGGDFYDFIPLGTNELGFVIGDVSDKGLPAALFMALTFSLLRAESERSSDPAEILEHVNRSLLKMNASGMFVTLIYAVLDYRTGIIQYARAGHLLPILLDGRGVSMPLRMDLGQPLGIFPQVKLDVQEIVLVPSGNALFFTDGLNEAINERGKQFGIDGITRTLNSFRSENSRTICRKLYETVKTYSQSAPNQDDFAVISIKRAPTYSKPEDLSKPMYW